MNALLPQDQVFWYLKRKSVPACHENSRADVVIIGGGMAGISAAHAFQKKGKKVILLEQHYCGAGATGKSSGFITPNAELSFTDFIKQYDAETAHTIWDFISSGVEDIRNNINNHQLVCDYALQDTFMLANTSKALKSLEIEHNNLAKFGYKTAFYTQEMLTPYIGSNGYSGAVSYEDTFGINGYLYCQEMKNYLQRLGVIIFEETQVIGIDDHTVKTPHATITADYIVVCTDRFMPELGLLTQEVYHAQTFLMISEQLTDTQIQTIFPTNQLLVWDSDFVYNYFRITPDKRLLLGGGSVLNTYSSKPHHDSRYMFNKLTGYFNTKFPGLKIQFEQMWPGLIGLSKDIAPLAGRDKNKPFLYYISAAAGLPIAAALGRYSAENLLEENTRLDTYFSPYRSFSIGGAAQSILGTKLSFALSNSIRKFTLLALCIFTSHASADAELPTLDSLSLEQKIGQLFIVTAIAEDQANAPFSLNKPYRTDKEYVKELITDYHIGGVIFLGSNTCQNQVVLTQEFQQTSTIPLLIAQDFEWGLTMRLRDGVRFPRNQALGALAPEYDHLIYEMGYEIGMQCKALGVHMNLAPVVDVNNNPHNPVINDRSFGENKERVAQKGSLYIKGLQDAGIIACAKHFPGHGDTYVDSHYDLPRIDHTKERLYDIELHPFKQIIDEGVVKAIMSAHLEVPALEPQEHTPASLSSSIIAILKQELGFNGIIITDGLDMMGVIKHHEPGALELQALIAGNDILLCSTDVPKAIATIKQAVLDGTITQEMLDYHVSKILVLKEWAGCSCLSPDFDYDALHSEQAYRLKEELYTHVITIARDDAGYVPVTNPATCIQIGQENGLSHFNITLHNRLLAPFYAIPIHAEQESIDSIISQITTDTVIVSLLGMSRFARDQFNISASTLYCLEELKKAEKKVIAVVFGNAYSVPLLADASAVIIAYEDAIQAQEAAAQVIIGTIQPTGILPVLGQEKH